MLAKTGKGDCESVRLLAEGCARKEAAHRLGIAISTLQTHLRRALRKADAASTIELLWRVVAIRDEHRLHA